MTGHPGSLPVATWCPTSAPSRSEWATASTPPAPSTAGCAATTTGRRQQREPASFDLLNTWYYADAPRTVQPELELARRRSTFEEVHAGLDESNALFEARRCLSCGNCFACDNCYGVCPDNAVIKLEPSGAYSYAIDLDYCKGCGICAEECPAGAIRMVEETV